jgi:hypothetical protein
MTDFVNYSQILSDFRDGVEAANLGFKKVFKNASDIEYDAVNMPMADCCLKSNLPLNTSGQTYYNDVQIEVQIACFNLTSRDICATMCADLANGLQRWVQTHSRFSSFVDATQVGATVFQAGETRDQGQFVAAAILMFHVKLYSET